MVIIETKNNACLVLTQNKQYKSDQFQLFTETSNKKWTKKKNFFWHACNLWLKRKGRETMFLLTIKIQAKIKTVRPHCHQLQANLHSHNKCHQQSLFIFNTIPNEKLKTCILRIYYYCYCCFVDVIVCFT